ncbi:DUF6146 family protein [Tenacibaculum sp. UWU-22]|uniref:DUF6146 family protein n=1 Tax=Tenacibaculum sp. UWU-22 TaxID=3234187 RepID=UPI0034DAE16D
MKLVKQVALLCSFGLFIWACGSSKVKNTTEKKEEPVVIANDSLEYEITIIDVGFERYLNSVAKPRGYYSQAYLENRNAIYVSNWNYRARNPSSFNPNIYENEIDYNPNTDYGYEVNYKLFNYFEFAQHKYRMSLNGALSPRY